MLIGELSKQTGLSRDTIRFYEKTGLIAAGGRPAGTRVYKDYGEETVERLSMISQGKTLGFTLGEIKQLLEAWTNEALPPGEQIRVVESKLAEIDQKMQRLSQVRSLLAHKLDKLQHDAQRDAQ